MSLPLLPLSFLFSYSSLINMFSSANCGDWAIIADPKGKSFKIKAC